MNSDIIGWLLFLTTLIISSAWIVCLSSELSYYMKGRNEYQEGYDRKCQECESLERLRDMLTTQNETLKTELDRVNKIKNKYAGMLRVIDAEIGKEFE